MLHGPIVFFLYGVLWYLFTQHYMTKGRRTMFAFERCLLYTLSETTKRKRNGYPLGFFFVLILLSYFFFNFFLVCVCVCMYD